MTAPVRAALHQALAVTGTAFAVAVFHVGQPFLGVLAAQATAGIPCRGGRDLCQRLGSAWSGSLGGALVLTAFPQQPWLSLPVFAALSGWGTRFAIRQFGPAAAILFAMGICGSFSAGIVFPAQGLFAGAAHALSLTLAIAVTVLLDPLGVRPAAAQAPPAPGAWLMGGCCAGSLVLALVTLPAQSVVVTIAALTCVIGLGPEGRGIVDRVAAGVAGAVAALIFLVGISALTNDLAAYLVAMGFVVGALEAMAWMSPRHGAACRQAGAMFAVTATILPRPEESLQASGQRMAAVLLGIAVAGAFGLAGAAMRRGNSRQLAAGSLKEPVEPRPEGP